VGRFHGYQRTGALKAAIELDVFSRDRRRHEHDRRLAAKCGAAPRGLQALLGRLVADEARRPRRRPLRAHADGVDLPRPERPGYVGSAITFIASAKITECFGRLTEAVRKGGTAIEDDGTLSAENPVWVEFARAMAPIAGMTALLLANLLEVEKAPGGKVLDIAAGHGMFGIVLARMNRRCR
jgi:hypothetical protein